MMNIPPSEAKALTLWEYEGILWNHNEAHGSDELPPPDPATAMPLLDKLNSDPRLTRGKPKKARNLPTRQATA